MHRQMRRAREAVAVALPWPARPPAEVQEEMVRQGLHALGIAARVGFLAALLYGVLA